MRRVRIQGLPPVSGMPKLDVTPYVKGTPERR